MQIVLSTPPADGNARFSGGFPQMGLFYLSASLAHVPELSVHILDATVEGLSTGEAVKRIVDLEPSLFGISVLSINIDRGLELLRRVKAERPAVRTILGGPHATMFDDLLLREVPELDMVARGEAEESFPELCARLRRGEDVAGVPGLSYRNNGQVVRGTSQIVENLDALPSPSEEILNCGIYYNSWPDVPLNLRLNAASILTSRGCPHRCAFCSKLGPEFNQWRTRSPENIYEELCYLRERGIDTVWVHDDNFTLDAARVERLCRLILDGNLSMRFFCQGSLHHLSQATFNLMKRAGVDLLGVGVESGSDEQRARLGKAVTSKDLASSVRKAKKAHIWVHSFFIVGSPGESPSQHEATKRFIRMLRPHSCDVLRLSVYPGSPLWQQLFGNGPPKTLAETYARKISEFPGQCDEETLGFRRADLHNAVLRTWLHWSRARELIGLLLHNALFRNSVMSALRNPRAFIIMIRALLGRSSH